MASNNNLHDFMVSVADAIRAKGGTTDAINPQDFATKIAELPSGGNEDYFPLPVTGHADSNGLRAIGWTDDDIAYYQKYGVYWNEEEDSQHLVSDANKALYANATKVIVDGKEMANGSNLASFKTNKLCEYLPKTDVSGLAYSSLTFGTSSKYIVAIPRLNYAANVFNGNTPNFGYCTSLTSVDLRGVSVVFPSKTTASSPFLNCYSLLYVDLSEWNTSEARNFNNFFNGCRSLVYVDVSNFSTGNVTSMTNMFTSCNQLRRIDVENWDVHNCTDFGNFASDCPAYKNINSWNTSSATTLYKINPNSPIVKVVAPSTCTNLASFIQGCQMVKELDMTGSDTSNVTDFSYMIYQVCGLRRLILGNGFNFNAVTNWNKNIQAGLSSSYALWLDPISVKEIIGAYARTTTPQATGRVAAPAGSVVYDADGSIQTLLDAAIANGYTFSGITITNTP